MNDINDYKNNKESPVKQSNYCNYCNKNFLTKSSLIYHQKNAKYCLENQGIKNNENKCTYCSKILSSKSRLESHFSVCKSKKQEQDKVYKDNNILKQTIHHLEIQIKDLKNMLNKANETISEIAKQPKTTNNTNNNHNRIKTQNNIKINNTQIFDINNIERISKVLDNYLTPDVLCKGQKGLAEMLKQHLLQTESGEPLYECIDVSRQKFEFVNTDGNVETDPKATKLLRSLNKSGVWDKAHNTGKKLWEKDDGSVNYDAQTVHLPKVAEILDINEDSTKLRTHLANITSRR